MEKENNPKQPKLSLHHLDNVRRVGRQWQCTCPVCGTRHLFVNPETGLFKCFYAGCPYKGIAEEKKTYRSRANPAAATSRPQPRYRKEDDCDYLSGIEDD